MKWSPARRSLLWLSLVCLPLAFYVSTTAQDKDWRPVTPEELSSKTPVVEPDADAEAIFWEVRIDNSSSEGFSLRHYVRVKIFTERGREKYSKFDVPFVKGYSKIKDLFARVVKADGSTVDIKPEDIFEREIIKVGGAKLKARSFAVPNIEPGVIVEYRYKETFRGDAASGLHLDFQKDIPVQRLAYYYKPYSGNKPRYQAYNFTDTQFVKDKDGYWLALRTDVPALKEEPRMPPEDSVRAWMRLTSASLEVVGASDFNITYVIKNPGNPGEYWGAVGTQYSPLVKFMNKGSDDIKKTAASLTADAANPDEKLRKLYEFVQREIANTSFDPSITDEQREKLPKTKSMNDVLKRKSASAQYIDMLFGSMAHAAGFETAIAFSGDRSKMDITPAMTNEDFIHAAAVAVKVDGTWKYFNPGVKFLPYGMLTWKEEDTWALIVGEERYDWKRTPLTEYTRSASNRRADLKLNDDGSLEGDVVVELNGHPGLSYRLDNYDETDAKREQSLIDEVKAQISAAEVSNVTIDNLMDSSKPLVQKYHVRVPSYAQKTGKRLFVQPNFFKYGTNADFTSSTRKYDIAFRYPWGENDEVQLTWPANFELDNADSPGDVSDPRKIGELTVRMTVDRSQHLLKYSRKFHFGGGGSISFGSQMYTPLKGMFDAFHTADSHTVTLKQK